jgi:hypothetical protein
MEPPTVKVSTASAAVKRPFREGMNQRHLPFTPSLISIKVMKEHARSRRFHLTGKPEVTVNIPE